VIVAKLGDYIREECHPLGSLGAQELRLVGVSNEQGLHASSRDTSADLARYQRIDKNWFAYNPMRVNVGSIGLADEESKTGFTSPDYTVFSCREGLDPHYLLHFLKSDYGLEAIARNCSGAVRKRLYYSGLAEIELPVPSMDDQIAFVRRINHISDTIRLIRDENSDRHELPKLKQAILQEAIQGKLTAEWRAAHPDMDPATQLLHRIQAEKARLIAAKKLRPEKPLPKITPAEIPFEIPKGWEWCRLASVMICRDGERDPISKAERERRGKGFPYYGASGVIDSIDGFTHDGDFLLVGEDGSNLRLRSTPVAFGASGKIWVNNHAHVLEFIEPVLQEFVSHRLNGMDLSEFVTGGFQPKLSQENLNRIPIPLPPLAEQAAIVERVEALMTTCRALEAEIEHARTHAAHLLQAVLKEAFAPAAA
jgi:restriction endonuclease S subunit